MPEGVEISTRTPARARPRRRGFAAGLWWGVRAALVVLLGYYIVCVAGLVYLRFLPPLATTVHLQRAVEAAVAGERPRWEYRWVPASRISQHASRAAVAAEDGRFFRHDGFDREEMRLAIEQARARGERPRGASTITHQLIKNLFFTTHRNPLRKGYEWALTYPAEAILGKDRILLLYLNVVEFDDGLYGIEAASRHYYGVPAAQLTRYQAAGLAAVLPNPRQRTPQGMGWYRDIILQRMGQMGW